MDLQLKAFTGAVHLLGIVAVLRKLYQPRFDLGEPLRTALDAMAREERSRDEVSGALSKAA